MKRGDKNTEYPNAKGVKIRKLKYLINTAVLKFDVKFKL